MKTTYAEMIYTTMSFFGVTESEAVHIIRDMSTRVKGLEKLLTCKFVATRGDKSFEFTNTKLIHTLNGNLNREYVDIFLEEMRCAYPGFEVELKEFHSRNVDDND